MENLNISRVAIDHWHRKEVELKQYYDRELLRQKVALAKTMRRHIPIQVKLSLLVISGINAALLLFNFTVIPSLYIFWSAVLYAIFGTAAVTYFHTFPLVRKRSTKVNVTSIANFRPHRWRQGGR